MNRNVSPSTFSRQPVVTRPRVPRNTTSRDERVAAWNEARTAGLQYQPQRLTGRDARYRWQDAIVSSDLAPTTRLVAHTLVMHGGANGANIFPGTRRLATSSGLSVRAVCEHLDRLVRRGFLHREARHGNTAGARGFRYSLLVPKVLTQGKHVTVLAAKPGASARAIAARIERQHSADLGALSADADDMKVLTGGQHIQQVPTYRPTHLLGGTPAGAQEGTQSHEPGMELP